MKHTMVTISIGIAAALFQSSSFAAVDAAKAEAKAKEFGCLNCHAVDTKKMGPAYKDVSAKYKGKSADDVAKAMKAIAVHKSVLAKTNDADLKMIFEWILSL